MFNDDDYENETANPRFPSGFELVSNDNVSNCR